MKKINVILIIGMMLCSMMILSSSMENIKAIDQHEASDGVVYGIIQNNTHTDNLLVYIDRDSMVTSENPNNPFGGSTNTYTQWEQTTPRIWRPLFGGTLTSIPSDAIIITAELRIWCQSLSGTGSKTVKVHRITGPWTEGAVTWNTQPNHDATETVSLAVDTGSVWYDFDVTDDVQNFVNGAYTDYGWKLLGVEAGDDIYQEFYTKENGGTTYDPSIYIEYEIRFNTTRDVTIVGEKNNFSFVPGYNISENVTLKVPLSNNAQGILNVTNNTDNIEATEVNTSDELINNTYWYDSANQFIWIRTTNFSTSSNVNWTINCSYGVNFNLIIPSYLEIGQYFHSQGFISDTDGNTISGMIAETRLLFVNGTDALDVNPKWNCTDGNYKCTFSTTALIPGMYSVSIEFTVPDSGIKFKEGSTLYLSVDPGSGTYISTFLHFTFYNNNTGIGIPSESFKIYASTDIVIDSTDRIYVDLYNVYTGQTIYYRITDYFDNQVYPTSGDYETLAIISIEQFEDIPITWYSIAIKNLNSSIQYFTMENGSRYYNVVLFPMDSTHIDVIPGSYNITKSFYSPINGTLIKIETDTLSVTSDGFYIVSGFDAMVHVSWYNTNEGLGLPDEKLKLYIDGTRQISQTFWTYANRTINVTIKDYYNLTMYTGNFTLNSTYTFLDFGLTFHSYKFCNLNNEYYMLSFLKSGGSRWFERGICPYETVEFLLPSGTYSLRIYDANNNTLYDNGSISMVNSKLYVINGSHLQLIIDGQSVIVGDLLELSLELDYALMPDIEIISCNPPMVFSTYDKEGMAIGVNIYKICPALITIATTKVETTGNWINTTARIPGNDTVTNGTITILSDELYISGSGAINWVNITYTDNGTLYQNTTYIPSKINLYGQNLTINASGNIHILRETQYNQLKKFYWTYYSDTGKHTAGIDIINSMDVPLYDVYNYVEFSNQSTPDPTTIIMRDVSNAGVVLKSGEQYDTSLTGIHFFLLSIDSDSTRGFTFEYYKRFDDAYNYGETTITVSGYIDTVWNSLSFNTFDIGWINNENTIFRGGLYTKLDFDDATDINPSSMRIWDEDNNQELSSSDFVYGSGFIRIGSDGLGDVNPGSGRSFSVYFLLNEYPGSDPTEIHLNTALWTWSGFAFTPFFFIFLIGLILIGYSVYVYMYKKKSWDICKNGIVLGVFIIFIFYVLAYMGI